VVESDFTLRASSFGSVAENYDRFRPGPPIEAVDWILQSSVDIAADVGAGTGALTRRLAERAASVIALEPDPRMLEVLKRRSPEISAVRSWAENLPIDSGQLDAVMISSAWHWMDPERTVAEIGRVLRSGGVLGVIWNGADRSVDWVSELLGTREPSPGDANRTSRHRFALPQSALFDSVEGTTIPWTRSMNRLELVGLAETYNSMITMSPDEMARELSRVESVASSLAGEDTVEIPMGCRCWRAVRH
jgi:SAM-dependent methyltransferase